MLPKPFPDHVDGAALGRLRLQVVGTAQRALRGVEVAEVVVSQRLGRGEDCLGHVDEGYCAILRVVHLDLRGWLQGWVRPGRPSLGGGGGGGVGARAMMGVVLGIALGATWAGPPGRPPFAGLRASGGSDGGGTIGPGRSPPGTLHGDTPPSRPPGPSGRGPLPMPPGIPTHGPRAPATSAPTSGAPCSHPSMAPTATPCGCGGMCL